MNQQCDKRSKRAERARLAYRSMSAEQKKEYLQRRRDAYRERSLRKRKFAEPIQEFADVDGQDVVESANVVQRHAYFRVSSFANNIGDLPGCNAIEIDQQSSALSENDTFASSAAREQARRSRGNGQFDRFARLAAVFCQPWKLPGALNCQYCSALKFYREPPSFCCSNGEIVLAPIIYNPILRCLFTSDISSVGVRFRRRVRTYNNNFALTSIGMTTDSQYCWSNKGIYTLKVNGQVSHRLEAFNPSLELPRRLQLYFIDTSDEISDDVLSKYDLDADILNLLIHALANNPYFQLFKRLRSWDNLQEHTVVLRANPTINQKTYNLPTEHQVAGIWDETYDDLGDMSRDIRVYDRNNQSHPVLYYFGCYDPLQYPLLFPNGEPGWHTGIERNIQERNKGMRCVGQNIVAPIVGQSATELLGVENQVYARNQKKRKNVSCREYISYRCQIRENDQSCIIHSGRLGQQYSIDSYIKIETQRLDYYRLEQQQIDARLESLQGIVDSLSVDGLNDAGQIGRRIVLPSSFIGGPRDMMKRYVNAMSLVQHYGNADLFITITCNPNWKEITEHLLPTETTNDRPDLVARVFKAKLEELKDEIIRKKLFGEVAAYVYVVEYQKRGLPHAHWILILKKHHKLLTPELYDKIISAEIPSDAQSLLYSYVVSHMMHGPCGLANPKNVCMKDGKCKNRYPKEFCQITTHAKYTYPCYRRRNDGRKAFVRNVYLDNRYVVPYCPYLLSKFDCHINVEACSNFKLVKYLYKYVYKGHDRICYNIVSDSFVDSADEIRDYQNGRWICAIEAYWRIFGFDITEMYPSVIVLPIHLPNQQYVCFGRTRSLSEVLANPLIGKTMLTEFFKMNSTNDIAKNLNLLYKEFPQYFVWEQKERTWKLRKKQVVLGRLAVVNPCEGERYFLRILLSNIRGPKSYEQLLTVNGNVLPTFRAAALHRNFLQSDVYIEQCLEEASTFQMPSSLRKLFAILLVHNSPPDPKYLFVKFFDVLSDDFCRNSANSQSEVQCKTLQSIDDYLMSMGRSIHEFALTSHFQQTTEEEKYKKELAYEKNIRIPQEDLLSIQKLNEKQRIAFHSIIQRVDRDEPGAFFIDGPGGTGKTFLYRALLAHIRSKGSIALAVASSGVAASLLPGGRTAHSRFKLPIDPDEKNEAKISKQSSLAKMILIAKLIIWDEASMANRKIIEAFDSLLRDITDQKNQVFGGKVIVFGGDFRQTLPIVPHGTRAQMINASFVMSKIWPSIKKIQLEENIRAKEDQSYTSFLLRIGDGKEPFIFEDNILIPDNIFLPFIDENQSLIDLIDFIFPSIDSFMYESLDFVNRAILTPKNDSVIQINNILIDKMQGSAKIYKSFNKAKNPHDQAQYEDFFASVNSNSLPPHELILKIHSPIMLLRNLNPVEGLCNGTRLICQLLSNNFIQAQIATGDHKGKSVFIPRIPLECTDKEKCPISFYRFQFPIRPCFAMTINKAQGQTLDFVGIYLPQPVFSHGQLYVALSRAKKATAVKVLIVPSLDSNDCQQYTKNIVYEEIYEMIE